MSKLNRTLLLLTIILATLAANAQETPQRTWIAGGFTFGHSTAQDSRTVSGAYLDAAYDLRHGMQARGRGEYRGGAAVPNLFTGRYDASVRTKSQLTYAGALVGYLPVESLNRVFVGGGVSTIRHFFKATGRAASVRSGARYDLYNSSVNPMAIAGVAFRNSEIVGAYYFPDTYSYSGLRGFGGEFSHTRKVSGYFHFRGGVRARYFSYREGNSTRRREAGEVFGFVGVQIR